MSTTQHPLTDEQPRMDPMTENTTKRLGLEFGDILTDVTNEVGRSYRRAVCVGANFVCVEVEGEQGRMWDFDHDVASATLPNGERYLNPRHAPRPLPA